MNAPFASRSRPVPARRSGRCVGPARSEAGPAVCELTPDAIDLLAWMPPGRGDQGAFAQLVESRLDRAFRTACAILGNEADARDATQEAFVSAWVNLPRLREIAKFDAWLNRVLINRCRDVVRRRHRVRQIEVHEFDLLGVSQTGASVEAAALEAAALNAAFDRLSLAHRQLLVLHHLHREPVAEIARQLGVPVGTAKWRLHAAREALERALEIER